MSLVKAIELQHQACAALQAAKRKSVTKISKSKPKTKSPTKSKPKTKKPTTRRATATAKK